jgi:hypothetical protein
MEINGTGPWLDSKNGAQRLDAPLRMEMPYGSDGAWVVWNQPELSFLGLEISQFRELIQTIPDIREERITEVRSDIEGGFYSVMAEKIAEKIIGDNLLAALF